MIDILAFDITQLASQWFALILLLNQNFWVDNKLFFPNYNINTGLNELWKKFKHILPTWWSMEGR